jgi:phosphosulfolactate phosphohydrolase-like enzyme
MREGRQVLVDCLSETPVRLTGFDAVVLIDVLCDTTTLVTSVAQGRRTLPAANGPAALQVARTLRTPLLAASDNDTWRPGFELGNSPVALSRRTDQRPLVLSCWAGATLAEHAFLWPQVYVACLRNLTATAHHLTLRHERVLVVDAANDTDVRCEDQMAAGRIVRGLVEAGFAPSGIATRETLDRWSRADLGLISWGRSAEALRHKGRHDDIAFVLSHVDDLELVCEYTNGVLEPRATAGASLSSALA